MFTPSRQETPRFEWGSFVSGIIFILAGIFMIRHQDVALRSLVLVFGIISIIQGLVWLAAFDGLRGWYRMSWLALIPGIIDFLIGFLFLFRENFGAISLAVIFAIWFLTDSIIGIVFAWHLKDYQFTWFIVMLIFNILSLFVAIMMLMNPVVSAVTLIMLVAFYFIIYGVGNILQAIAHH